ncbi:MAG: SPASM domain-containing protein [Alkaliphilus sp.]
MTEDVRDNVYNFIVNQAEERGSKIISIVLFGGEPLLNFKRNMSWLDRIKEYCDSEGRVLVTTLVTNGVLITNETLDELKKYNCKQIQITLDGIREIHNKRRIMKNGRGSFEDVIRGIKTIYNRKDFAKPVIRVNIDKANIDKTCSLLEYLNTENLNECNIDFGIVRGGTEACSSYAGNCFIDEELAEVLEGLWDKLEAYNFRVNNRPNKKFMFCGLYGDASFTITPYGEIYKCWEHVGDKKHLMGKINEKGHMTEMSYAYYDWMSRNPLETEECNACVYLPACGGGCGSISYEQEGTYHGKGCFKTKGVLEKQVKRMFYSKCSG